MCLGHQAGSQLQPKSYGSSGQDLPRLSEHTVLLQVRGQREHKKGPGGVEMEILIDEAIGALHCLGMREAASTTSIW